MKIFFTNSSKIIIPILFIIAFGSCNRYGIEYRLAYETEPLKNSSAPDKAITLQIPADIDSANTFNIIIENNSSEMLILDERYFTLTENGQVVKAPIGLFDPNLMNSHTSGFISGPVYGEPAMAYADLYADLQTSTKIPQPNLVIPPGSHVVYPIFDYPNNIFDRRIYYLSYWQNNSLLYFDSKKLKALYKELEGNQYTIVITFKFLNEDKWRSVSAGFKLTGFKVEKITYDPLEDEFKYEFIDN